MPQYAIFFPVFFIGLKLAHCALLLNVPFLDVESEDVHLFIFCFSL